MLPRVFKRAPMWVLPELSPSQAASNFAFLELCWETYDETLSDSVQSGVCISGWKLLQNDLDINKSLDCIGTVMLFRMLCHTRLLPA